LNSSWTNSKKLLNNLWTTRRAWQTDETNLRCAEISRIYMLNPSIAAFLVSELTVVQSDRRRDMDMARSNRLVILIKNIYILYGVGNASFCCYILSYASSIPFYSTSNEYENGTIMSINCPHRPTSPCDNIDHVSFPSLWAINSHVRKVHVRKVAHPKMVILENQVQSCWETMFSKTVELI